MFYIGTEKSIKEIQNLGKTETGFKLKIIYTDLTESELIIETGGTGGSGGGTSGKYMTDLTMDKTNDGFLITFSDGTVKREYPRVLPIIDKSLKQVRFIEQNGKQKLAYTTNGNIWTYLDIPDTIPTNIYSELKTTNKTIIGAINELYDLLNP